MKVYAVGHLNSCGSCFRANTWSRTVAAAQAKMQKLASITKQPSANQLDFNGDLPAFIQPSPEVWTPCIAVVDLAMIRHYSHLGPKDFCVVIARVVAAQDKCGVCVIS